MELGIAELEDRIAQILAAPPCSSHGRAALEYCLECDEVSCGLCRSDICECWSDEADGRSLYP